MKRYVELDKSLIRLTSGGEANGKGQYQLLTTLLSQVAE
jgi:hypothetical protein